MTTAARIAAISWFSRAFFRRTGQRFAFSSARPAVASGQRCPLACGRRTCHLLYVQSPRHGGGHVVDVHGSALLVRTAFSNDLAVGVLTGWRRRGSSDPWHRPLPQPKAMTLTRTCPLHRPCPNTSRPRAVLEAVQRLPDCSTPRRTRFAHAACLFKRRQS